MWELIIELAIYLVISLAALAVAAWGVVTGQFLDIDGLFLVLVCLSIALVFLTAFALAVRNGDFALVLAFLRRSKPAPAPAPSAGKPQPAGSASQVDESSRADA